MEDPFVRPSTTFWPPSQLRTGAFRTAIPARLTGHGVPDVVLLEGLYPVIATAPGIHTHVENLIIHQAFDVYDIAVLSGRGFHDGSHPALDALALATDEGLKVWRRHPTTGVITITDQSDAPWLGVRRLATHPSDTTVIFGIDDNGVVQVAEHTSTGYSTVPVTFPVLQDPLDIECVDRDGDNITELAVVTRTGLTFVNRMGNTVVPEESKLAMMASLTILRGGPGLDEECLAWLTPASGGGSELRLRSSATFLDVPLYREYVGIAAADWSGDGNEDAVLSTALNLWATVLFNLSYGQPVVSCTGGTAVDVAIAATGHRALNGCPVATADFDGDGDGDLVAAVEPVSPGPTLLRKVQSKLYDSPSMVTPQDVRYDANLENVTILYTHAPGGTHTRLTVWKLNSGELEVNHHYGELRNHNQTGAFVVQLDQDHFDNGGGYGIMIQPVSVVNGNVVAWAEAALVGLNIVLAGGGAGTPVTVSNPTPPLPPPPPEQPPPGPG